jgi:hypothetical protein
MPVTGAINSAQKRRAITGWKLLRALNSDGDDPDWLGDLLDPDTMLLTVGGTASDGLYEVTFTSADGSIVVVSSFDRQAGESNAEIGTALAAEIATDMASYISSATSDTAVISAVWGRADEALIPKFTVTLSAPGSGALSLAPGVTWPITAQLPYELMQNFGTATSVRVVAVAVDSSGDVLPHEGTANLTLVEMIRRPDGSFVAVGDTAVAADIGSIDANTINGADRWTLRVDTIANESGSLDTLELWYRIQRS